MTAAGWTIMASSLSLVIGMATYCLYRVLTLPPVEVEEHLKAPLEIETPDQAVPE